MSREPDKIRISWDDVDRVKLAEPSAGQVHVTQQAPASGQRSWGSISDQVNAPGAARTAGGSLFLKGWFYLGVAGLVGAFLAWAICEPWLDDSETGVIGWGGIMLVPLVVIFISTGLGVIESVVERSWTRALLRGLASAGLGLVFGFIFFVVGGIIYAVLISLVVQMGVESEANPLAWVCRALAWAAFGLSGGLLFGIVSKSGKKILYGMLGGSLGAALGGLLFDPISLVTHGGEASRAIGMVIVGASTGIAIGLVESALKERWLYVSGGPLAGKQFVLYQDLVTLGRSQACTIYLFKDDSILEHHATVEQRAGKSVLVAMGPVFVAGQTLQHKAQRVLDNGDVLQIGRYTFTYAEKERARKP